MLTVGSVDGDYGPLYRPTLGNTLAVYQLILDHYTANMILANSETSVGWEMVENRLTDTNIADISTDTQTTLDRQLADTELAVSRYIRGVSVNTQPTDN